MANGIEESRLEDGGAAHRSRCAAKTRCVHDAVAGQASGHFNGLLDIGRLSQSHVQPHGSNERAVQLGFGHKNFTPNNGLVGRLEMRQGRAEGRGSPAIPLGAKLGDGSEILGGGDRDCERKDLALHGILLVGAMTCCGIGNRHCNEESVSSCAD